jgi:hypothetical protein
MSRAHVAEVVSNIDAARTALNVGSRGPVPLFFTDTALAHVPLQVQRVILQTGDAYSATVIYAGFDGSGVRGQLWMDREPTANPNVFGGCVGDPITEPMTLGRFRNIYLGHCDIDFVYQFDYQNRLYRVASKYYGGLTPKTLAPIVADLTSVDSRTLPKDLCAREWPGGHSVHRRGGRLVYDRRESLRMVCQGFGTDTGGLHVDWLTSGMKCAVIATAVGVRYHINELFVDGPCSAVDVARYPGVVAAIGAACATASDLLGLPYPVLGKLSGLACASAPAVGTGFGTWLESHHEFAVAKDVIRRGRCLEFRQYSGVSSWHAARCEAGS